MPALDEIDRFQDEVKQHVELMVNNAISMVYATSHAGHTIGREASIAKLMILDNILVKARSQVRTHMNTLAPVHKLPPEILSQIFALVPSGYFKKRDCGLLRVWGPSAVGPPSHLVPLMKVCHRWNETLTQNATFWTVVEDESQELDDAWHYTNYLHRNLDGPLSVIISPLPTPRTIILVRDSSSRVKELFVNGEDECKDITHLTNSPLFSLGASSLMKCMLEEIYSNSPSLLLFQGNAPCLAYLWLCTLSWVPSNTFPSLTHLFVDYGSKPNIPKVNYSFANLLALLDGSPRLQVLYLNAVGRAQMKDVPEPGTFAQRVQLLHLRKLSVLESKSSSRADHFQVAVCSHIDRPTDCLVRLSVHGTSGLGHLVKSLSNPRLSNMRILLPEMWKSSSGSTIPLFMSLQMVDDLRSTAVWLRLNLSLRALKPLPGEGIAGNADRREVFHAAVTGYGLFNNLKVLNITWYAMSYMLETPSIFDQFASLQTLAFDKIRRSVGPAKALSILRPASDAAECATVKFPQLKRLAIKIRPPVGLEELHDILRSRREAGYGIKNIVLVFTQTPEVPTPEELHTLTQLRREAKISEVYGIYGEQHTWPKSLTWALKLPTECLPSPISDMSLLWPTWV
ncbi:hypothetical protein C8Q80DRAFT_1145944 [Daedaleopsis nitida]|nr:hypothetical protein C8Q80DRAFT_1145944 [Daedaleopsis nitida]